MLDMSLSHASKQIPLTLGCLFLATVNSIINYRSVVMDVSIMSVRIRHNIFKSYSQPMFDNEFEDFFIDIIDETTEEALPVILSKDPLEI